MCVPISERLSRGGLIAARAVLPNADVFFFPTSHCRLCGAVSDRRVHLATPRHQAAESLLWLFAARCGAVSAVGVAPTAACCFARDEAHRWDTVLRGPRAGPPVQSAFPLLEDPASVWRDFAERRAAQLRSELRGLERLGVIGPRSSTREFERAECIGDHTWGAALVSRLVALFPEVDWRAAPGAGLADTLRTVLESNEHLDHVHRALFGPAPQSAQLPQSAKARADIVEALGGALSAALWALEPVAADGVSRRAAAVMAPYAAPVAAVSRRCREGLCDLVLLSFVALHAGPLADTVVAVSRKSAYAAAAPVGRQRRRRPLPAREMWTLPQPPVVRVGRGEEEEPAPPTARLVDDWWTRLVGPDVADERGVWALGAQAQKVRVTVEDVRRCYSIAPQPACGEVGWHALNTESTT